MAKSSADASPKNSSDVKGVPELTGGCTGLRLAFIFLALCTTVFLVALDGTILATAIPTITDHFDSLSDIAWYNSAYLLTTCAFQLPFGRAYTLLDSKWTFLVAVMVFEIGTAICGAAPSSFALIFGRAIAGIGGAGIFSGTFIIIAEIIPLRKRSLSAGLIGAVFAIASVIAPILGGVLTDRVSWRWCFYINLPLGAIVVAIITILLRLPPAKSSKSKEAFTFWKKAARFDPLGTLVLVPSLVCLLIALQWGGTQYPWSDKRVAAPLAVFAVSIVAWAALQWWEGENATVPWEVARQRSVAAATLYTLLGSAAFSLVVYYLPIWFQAIRSDTAEQSGIHTLALVLSLVVSSLVAGGLVAAIGYYSPFLVLGSVCMAVGGGLLMLLKPGSSTGEWIGYQIIFGVGIGVSLEQCNIAIQAVLPPEKSPAGISLGVFARSLGGAIAVAVGQNVFQQSLRKGLRQAVPELEGSGDDLVSGATDFIAMLGTYLDSEQEISTALAAYNQAVTRIFMVAMVLGCLTLLPALAVEWKSVKENKGDADGEGKVEKGQEKV